MPKISFKNLSDLKDNPAGLSDKEIELKRIAFGFNQILDKTINPWTEIIKETIQDPMIWFLFSIGFFLLLWGNKMDGAVLLSAIIPLIFMDVFLHWRTQASTKTLKSQLDPKVFVHRNNSKIEISSIELVPGDLVYFSAGVNLPADGIVMKAFNVQIDESILTGESLPVKKSNFTDDPFILALKESILINQDKLVFAGTRVLSGEGLFRVLFIGEKTIYGDIIHSLKNISHERTPLQLSIDSLVKKLIYIAVAICVVLAGFRIFQGHSLLDAFISSLTLAIAAIPEEFPVVLTFYLGVGIYRLSKNHALVRKAVSVENIGRVTHICSDKTGTITIGQLKLNHLELNANRSENELVQIAFNSCNPNGNDPVDLSIKEKAKILNCNEDSVLKIFPFSEERKKETVIRKRGIGEVTAFVKGSPETILKMCNLDSSFQATWLEKTSYWAQEGHKVLACAYKNFGQETLSFETEPSLDFEFAGLLIFEDPARPEVFQSIQFCQENGIHVIMLTGDHPETAKAIAKDIGLGKSEPRVISAENEPEKFQASWLEIHPTYFSEIDVVARCTPQLKLQIVKQLKNNGEVVAVTGDGVNDVPALKAADIGVAMGLRGTQSAKEVASIILMDDNFQTLTKAILEGRQLFWNLKKSSTYLLLFHFPFIFTALIIPLLGYPLLYLPIHIVWLELIIHPTALFAFQEELDLLSLPQKVQKNLLFTSNELYKIFLFGLFVTFIISIVFFLDIKRGETVAHARSLIMLLLSLWSSGLIFLLLKKMNFIAGLLISLTTIFSILLIQLPFFSKLLHMVPLEWNEILICLSPVFVSFYILQKINFLRSKIT